MSDFIRSGMDLNSLQQTKSLPRVEGKTDEKLMEAAREFEAMFMNLVMQKMREMVPDSEILGGSSKVKFFEGMLDEEFSKMSADRSGLGLADMIYRQMSRNMTELDSQGDKS